MPRNLFALTAILALLATGIEAHAACTAGNPNASVIESTPTSAFTDNGNGTVTHSLTGLMWKQCAEGLSGAGCAIGAATTMTWSAALATAAADATAGHGDWRLPNKKELESIVESCGYTPSINQALFPATPASYFWSGSSYVWVPSLAWGVNFNDGSTGAYSKTPNNYVRLVRGGQSFDTFDAQLDTIPTAFTFTAQTGVALSTVATSNTITVAGINGAANISIAGGTYSINGALPYISGASTVNNGDTVTVKQTSSGSFSTLTTATLTIGGVAGAFNVTTLAQDTTPNAFSLTAQTGVALSTVATSNTITVAGINSASAITIAGGTYSINGGAYTAAAGTVNNGDTVTVKQTSSGSFSTLTTATLTIGGVAGAFNVTTLAQDTTPNAFSFTAQTGVALNLVATSNTITVAGINSAANISIVGGTYSINGGGYTAVAGTVNNGDTVTVRQTSSGSFSTLTTATVTIGGVAGAFDVTTLAADTIPTAFTFTAQTGVALSTVATSNTITVAGINSAANISIAGGTYSINGGAYTAVAGTVNNGDTVTVRQTSSGSFSTLTTATLTIGGVAGAFNVTTLAQDTTPNAFSFTAQTGVALSTVATSNTITVAGINSAANISIAGGTYSVGGGAYTAAVGTVNNGQTVTVRQTASANPITTTTATLTIGGVSGVFSVTTGKASQTIGPITFTPSTLAVGHTSTASAVATSALAVTFSTASSACTATGTNGKTITGIAAGACLITANQAGNANYNAAPLRAQTLTVSATATPVVSLNRTALIFAARNLAKPSPAQAVTLTNTGASALNIVSIVATGDFARTTTCATTLAAGANCTLNVTFTATAMGARTGAITLTSNAAGSPHRITLTGTGKGTRYDFNGDGKSDLLWRNTTTGANQIWFMNGGIKTGTANTTTQAASWTIAGGADFNGDGKADILWRNAAGQSAIWLMNGSTLISSTILSPVMAAPWTVAGTGDFNGDGKADILWRNTATGVNQIWFMNGAARIGVPASTTTLAIAWTVAGVADFNGDGKTDILWRNAATGQDAVWLMNGATVMGGSGLIPGTIAAPWTIAGTGDFNADGKADILWRNPTTGQNTIWFMNGAAATGATTATLAASWSVAGVADFNGDGKADITWRGPLGATTLWLMNGAAVSSSTALAPAMAAPWSVAK